jgi:hypothetical protein
MNTATAHDLRLSSDLTASRQAMLTAVESWRLAQKKVRAYEDKFQKEAPAAYYRAMFNAEDRMKILGV